MKNHPYLFPNPTEATVAEARKCIDAAIGRNRRRYGKDQTSYIMQSVSSVIHTMYQTDDPQTARDVMFEVFKICSKLHGIYQGTTFNPPDEH